MHKCVVCGNKYKDTKINRPRVIYHGFPKDKSTRNKWLQVFKIDRCYDWHRVCSDHFLEKNYKPKKKRILVNETIPQPYGYSSKYALLSNDVETGNISPRQSSTPTTENMSNKNKPIRTLRSGLRCSIKNCFNRLSKNLSLFGYPKDFKLKKKWIEKCGLKNDPSEIIITGIRVCATHFELNCFKNIDLKNRLKRGAVPSIFLYNGPNDLSGSSIDEVPVLSAICEDQFITPIDNEVAEQSSEEKQNNVEGPNDLPGSSIDEVPVLTAICEDQFITPIDNEVAGQSSEEKQNNVEGPNDLPGSSIDEVPVLTAICEDQFITPIDNEVAGQSSEEKQNNVEGPNDLPGSSIDEVPVLTAICEDQFITPIDNEVAGQSSEEKQNNVEGPNDLPGSSIDEVPVLSAICEDQFITPIDNEVAEQSSEEKQNNVEDNNSMTIDLTIDDSSNDSLSITLEPIEKRTSQCVIMDVSNTEDFTRDEHGIIFDMSKEVILPSVFWKWEQHPIARNSIRFCQQDTNDVTVKIVHFAYTRVPTIEVYGKRYEHTTPITTNKELDELLEKVDSFQKCCGRGGFIFEQCLGYFEDTSLTTMCSGCEGVVQDEDLQKMRAKLEAINKRMESFNKKMAEKTKIILKLRKAMAKNKRKRQLALNPSGISNIMKP